MVGEDSARWAAWKIDFVGSTEYSDLERRDQIRAIGSGTKLAPYIDPDRASGLIAWWWTH